MLISSAYAQGFGSAGQMDMLTSFLPMAAIFVVFYFLLIRPQQKRAREQKDLLAALEKGNEVITAGGIVGRITKINEQYVTLEVTTGVEMTSTAQRHRAVAAQGNAEEPLTRPPMHRWIAVAPGLPDLIALRDSQRP